MGAKPFQAGWVHGCRAYQPTPFIEGRRPARVVVQKLPAVIAVALAVWWARLPVSGRAVAA